MYWVWVKHDYEFPFSTVPLAMLRGDCASVMREAAKLYLLECPQDKQYEGWDLHLQVKAVDTDNPDRVRYFRVTLDEFVVSEMFAEAELGSEESNTAEI